MPIFTAIIFTIGSGLCLLVAFLILLVFIISLRREIRFGRKSIAVSGTIIAIQERRSIRHGRGGSRTSLTYHPVVTFQPPNADVPLTIESQRGIYPNFFRVDQQVEVLYLANDSESMRINTFYMRWLGIWLLPFFGIFGLYMGISLLGPLFILVFHFSNWPY